MRISDWSSDVCSSDLGRGGGVHGHAAVAGGADHAVPPLSGQGTGAPVVMSANHKTSKLSLGVLEFGFAFLYLPILILMVYSFNESRLVKVRSDERRVGKECFGRCRSRGSP